MKRTTIFADEDLIKELKDISREENKSVAEVMREAMENYVSRKRKAPRRLSFIRVGSSGRKDVGEKHERLLWKKSSK